MNKCPRHRGRFCFNTEIKFEVLLFVVFFICISQGVRRSNGVVPKFLQLSVSIRINWHIINYLLPGLLGPYK